jgi:hypothetical protein
MKNIILIFLLLFTLNVKGQVTVNLELIHYQESGKLGLLIVYKNNSNKYVQLDNKGQIQIEKLSNQNGKFQKMIRPNVMFDTFDSHPVFNFWEIRNFEYLDFSIDSSKIVTYAKEKFKTLNDSLKMELSQKFFIDINRPLYLKPHETIKIKDNISNYLVSKGSYKIKFIFKKRNYDYLFTNEFLKEIGNKNYIHSSNFYNPSKNVKNVEILCKNQIFISIE